MIHGAMPTLSLPNVGYAINVSQGGRMSIPVSPASYIYSHFKHVSGVPAPEGVRGASINKLKILDVLIERLVQLKKQAEPAFTAGGSVSEDRIDALIEQYEGEIRQAQAAVSTPLPYRPAPAASPGAVFSLVA
ncbi:hypothetical protein AGMMS49928_12680 [Spirochaetia bacterium]|nr:hypothetical protein AGMMS49928_12680 [Spirochaetia bacterium]